jgi:excisionase family DNA binding protein
MGLIGTSEAARKLGISPRRVAAMIEQGLIKAEKVGKTWIISDAEIIRIAKRVRKSGRPPKLM